ncbi:MAG TPA: KGG domain-containing protein [Polyangiaceae bacterium]
MGTLTDHRVLYSQTVGALDDEGLGSKRRREAPRLPRSPKANLEVSMSDKPKRGFASMNQERQREIASKGGKAAHLKGRAHEFTPEQARQAGRKGGQAVSQDRAHMARIGRKGGEAVSGDRTHMAEIGRKGGAAVSEDRQHMADIGREGGHSVSGDRAHMAEIGREGGHRRQGHRTNPTDSEHETEAEHEHEIEETDEPRTAGTYSPAANHPSH